MMEESRRRRFARAAAIPLGLLASGALVFAGSQSAFTASTDNAGNTWTTGRVKLQNNGGSGSTFSVSTAALFTLTNLKPGTGTPACIVIENSSTQAGSVRVYRSAYAASPTALDSALQIKVEVQPGNVACASFSPTGTVYDGTLAGMPTTYATASDPDDWAPAAPVSPATANYATYRITYTVPDDNALQGKSTTATTFNWEIQS